MQVNPFAKYAPQQSGNPFAKYASVDKKMDREVLNWSDVPGEMIRNAPSDAAAVVKSIAGMVRHPLDTVQNISDVAEGAFLSSKTLQGANSFLADHGLARKRNLDEEANSPAVQKAQAVGRGLTESYGSGEGIKYQLAKHPIGTAMDASIVLDAPEAALARVPLKAAQTASKIIGKTADILNPISAVARPVKAAIQSFSDSRAVKGASKTSKVLQQATNNAYKVAEDTVGKQSIDPVEFSGIVRGMSKEATQKGLGGALSETTDKLYSHSKSVLKDMYKIVDGISKGERPSPTFGDLENMRKTLGDVVESSKDAVGKMNADGYLASKFIDHIDDAVAKTPFVEARTAYKTLRKTQRLERAITDAETRASSQDLALKNEFRKIIRENNRRPIFSPLEMAAIKRVANHGTMGNLLQTVGRLGFSKSSVFAPLVALGEAGRVFGLPGGLEVIAGTTAAKAIGTKLTKNAAGRARDIVGMGGDTAAMDAKMLSAHEAIAKAARTSGRSMATAQTLHKNLRKPLRLKNGSIYWNPAPTEYQRLIDREGAQPL